MVLRVFVEDVPEVTWTGLTRLRADRGALPWLRRPVRVTSKQSPTGMT
jgi:hypothetical protein